MSLGVQKKGWNVPYKTGLTAKDRTGRARENETVSRRTPHASAPIGASSVNGNTGMFRSTQNATTAASSARVTANRSAFATRARPRGNRRITKTAAMPGSKKNPQGVAGKRRADLQMRQVIEHAEHPAAETVQARERMENAGDEGPGMFAVRGRDANEGEPPPARRTKRTARFFPASASDHPVRANPLRISNSNAPPSRRSRRRTRRTGSR